MIEAYTGSAIRAAEEPFLTAGHGPALMRRAAWGLAGHCRRVLRERRGREAGARVVVLAGSGNNGGDGLWAGSFLARRGMSVTAVLTGSRAHPEGLAALRSTGARVLRLVTNASGNPASRGDTDTAAASPDSDDDAAVARHGEPAPTSQGDAHTPEDPSGADDSPTGHGHPVPTITPTEAAALLRAADLVLDAMLGTGASGGLRGPARELVETAQARGTEPGPVVVACDVVSGVDTDTGEVPGPVLAADLTVTFGAAKSAHVLAPAEQLSGALAVVPIGIEDELGAPDVYRVQTRDALAAWPRPGAHDTKYTRGVLGVIAGTPSYPGAAIMATRAAVDAGAGMVRYLGDASTRAMVLTASPEVVCSEDAPWDVHVQAWLAGPGVSEDVSQLARVRAAVEAPEPAVLDAGAVAIAAQAVADGPLGTHKILTPHAGELATLLEWLAGFGLLDRAPERAEIEAAPARWARSAARATGATVLLKGPTTVIASPVPHQAQEMLCVSTAHASPWLATAGSGDTLSGILGTVVAHVAEHPDALASLGDWACGEGRWAGAAALGAAVHAGASRLGGVGPVPPTVLAEHVRTLLREGTAGN